MRKNNYRPDLMANKVGCVVNFEIVLLTFFFLNGCVGTQRFTRQTSPSSEKKSVVNSSRATQKPVAHSVTQVKSSAHTSTPVQKKEKNETVLLASLPQLRVPDEAQSQISEPENEVETRFYQKGSASYYANKFQGKRTASGERYDKHALTAAHPKLPFNSYVKVTNVRNNRSVIVRINDRGPFSKSRIIDISRAAAEHLDLISIGVAEVIIEVVKK